MKSFSEFGYDARNRQTSNTIKKSDGTVVSAETYTYDNAGNLTQKVIDSTTTTFTYDGADQLLTETRAGATTTYTYDANGNRASKAAGGTTETYVVDDADKLTSITVGGSAVKTYGYDAAGRTTSVVTSAGTTALAYDYEGRISTITYPSSATNSFTYNGLDTRVGKVDSAGTTTYRRDGDDVLSPVLEAGGTKFTPGISRRTGTSSYFYHQDRMGSAVRQTNSTQGSLTSRQYDAFGNIAYVGGTWVGPFGFVGGEGYQEDSDSGLQLLGHRYYDPSTGRFLTRDPVKDGRNWYVYCRNNPLHFSDGDGLCIVTVGIGAGFIVPGATGSASGGIAIDITNGDVGIVGSIGGGHSWGEEYSAGPQLVIQPASHMGSDGWESSYDFGGAGGIGPGGSAGVTYPIKNGRPTSPEPVLTFTSSAGVGGKTGAVMGNFTHKLFNIVDELTGIYNRISDEVTKFLPSREEWMRYVR